MSNEWPCIMLHLWLPAICLCWNRRTSAVPRVTGQRVLAATGLLCWAKLGLSFLMSWIVGGLEGFENSRKDSSHRHTTMGDFLSNNFRKQQFSSNTSEFGVFCGHSLIIQAVSEKKKKTKPVNQKHAHCTTKHSETHLHCRRITHVC